MNSFYRLFLFLAFSLLFIKNVSGAGMSGAYTIDNSGKGKPDYTNFNDAVNDLIANGVSGAVVFKVADGKYSENLYISKIVGASPANTITFQSTSADSSKVLLDTMVSGAGGTYLGNIIAFTHASYITFRQMSIINTSNSFANCIQIGGGSSHISFENCILMTGTSAKNYGYCIYDSIGTDNNLIFKNNLIRGGEASIYAYGGALAVGGTKEKGLVLINNRIDSAWYDGVLMYSIDSLVMIGNTIGGITYSVALDNSYVTVKDTSIIANNFITSNGWGVWLSFTDKMKFYYNSVITNTNTSYYYAAGFSNGYATSTLNNFIYNNIFVSTGKSPAVYMTYTAAKKCDYNDIYSTSGTIATWNNTGTSTKTNCSTLSDWQKTSKFDKHGVSADPQFKSILTTDLHLTTASLKVLHKATPLKDELYDIDGEIRGNSPSMGADDVFQYFTDGAMLSIDSPAVGFCAGKKDIYATIFNAGIDSLRSATINWSVNGKTMPSVSWKGALGLFGSAMVKLDTLVFSYMYTKNMKVWISSPNGVTDSSAVNDTVYRTISAGLTGTYTLGGKSPDFPNFRSAVNALNKFGVCGPLVINVRDTSYNESVLLKSIPGSSAVNTVTFQSQSGDSTKVILDTAYASPYYFPHAAYVLRFDGTQYVTFRKMSITNTEMTVSSSNVVSMVDGANHITLENNLIYCPSGMNTGAVILTEPNTSESNITIRNNSIWGGAYGIYFAGNISILGPFEHSNVIEGNKVDTISSVGLYLQFQDSMQILANNIIVDGGYAVGIYAYDFTSTNKCNMINNFITAGGSSTYGLYSEQVLSMNMHYNSIATTGACLYTVYISASGGAKTSVMNNIMWSSSGVAYGGDPNGISSSDYNDIYANGWSLLISWMGTYSTVSAFSAATGMDKHSISVNANFVDVTNGDLHLTDSSGVRKKAKVISAITTDFDGQKRNATKPDIGADEFIHDSFDVGATAIVSPSNASCGNISSTIGVKIANFGLQAQSGFKVHVIINGKDSATTTFTGTLKGTSGGVPHDTIVNISFAKPWNTIGGGLYSIKAYTMLPNDSNHANDTITVKDSFYALPMLKFGYTRACLNDTAHFLDSSTSAASITSRTWNFGNSTKGSGAIGKTMYKSVGKYDVQLKVKDAHGCMDSLTRTVSIDSVNADFKFKYTGLVVDFTANNSKLKSYSWDFGDKSKAGTSYNPSHTYPAYNSYNVTLTTTNADGCIAIWSDSVRIFVTGIEGQTSGNAFSIYPNPAKDRLYITSPLTPLPRRGEQARAIITDISGKVLADQEIHSNESMINISTLPAGVYLLRYQDKDRVEVLKFVKE